MAKTAGIIDVGSTSVFLLTARRAVGGLDEILRRRVLLRLAAQRNDRNELSEAGIYGLISTLNDFVEVASGTPLSAVATASFRGLSNAQELSDRVRGETGLDLRVLSGEEEAAYAYRGVRLGNGSPWTRPAVVVDVGGGSTELAWGMAKEPDGVLSFELGVVRLHRECLLEDPVPPDAVRRAQSLVRQCLRHLSVPDLETGFACSGTMKRLVALHQGQAGPAMAAGLTVDQLSVVRERLQAAPSQEARLAMPGMDPNRADLLLAGALIFEGLSEAIGLERWELSAGGLRWGLLDEALDD